MYSPEIQFVSSLNWHFKGEFMKIITLIENLKSDSKDLINEHGLSLYIEKDSRRLLFDTGKTGNFIKNAKKLGISLEAIDAVVLSHGHYDHGGGLLPFLKLNSKAKVYMKREVYGDYYFHFMAFNKSIGIDKKIFEQYSSRIVYINEFTEIMDDIYLLGDIDKGVSNLSRNDYLFTKEKNRFTKDKFEHELIMVIRNHDGICIFTGCSHNGAINMVKTVKTAFPKATIKALIGGFHLIKLPIINLFGVSENEVNLIAKEIIEEDVEKVYTGHCTGIKAYKMLKKILGERIDYIKTGAKIYI